MGIHNAPNNCFITDCITENIPSDKDRIEYRVNYAKKRYAFIFDSYHKNSDFVENNKYILKGLILNNKFPYKQDSPYYNNNILESIIKDSLYPKTPIEKQDNLFTKIHSYQSFEGEEINFEASSYAFYFKNVDEFMFYLNTLRSKELIRLPGISTKDEFVITTITITYNGLQYLMDSQKTGYNSTNCFIAMSFSNELKKLRIKIKEACLNTGFNPILIDEIHLKSDVTINDSIIAEIRKSKFCIADFTEQKNGVYFESGYALGLGIPVIYCCKDDWFKETHFDTNHFSHIIYNNEEELYQKLVDKIEAWIK